MFKKMPKNLPAPVINTIYKAYIHIQTTYKAFVIPHLDHGDVFMMKLATKTFNQKLEYAQYNGCLALPKTARDLSREKFYLELGLDSFQRQRWCRKLSLFYKISKEIKPFYLFHLIPTKSQVCFYCLITFYMQYRFIHTKASLESFRHLVIEKSFLKMGTNK